ncbi:hypothetical protein VNO77_44853 [Canavalia gladiata]|uniref:Uncharacterized protein n=1 Tax=Canavalia gladiata TaxID=3824 RepID=A0AAN9JXR8_CANGL
MKLHNHLNEVPGRLGDAPSHPWCEVKGPLRSLLRLPLEGAKLRAQTLDHGSVPTQRPWRKEPSLKAKGGSEWEKS